jgi:hypothetical protein
MPDAAVAAEQALRAWLDSSGVEYAPGIRPGEHLVHLPGEAKLNTTVSVRLGARALSVVAFVVRRPDENHAAFYRWMLARNARLPGVAFALDRLGDVYLVGRLPLAGVTEDTIDDLLGAVLATADSSFNELLALGFLTAIRREWAWRTDRDESTRNLDAFRHLLDDPASGGPGTGAGADPASGGPGADSGEGSGTGAGEGAGTGAGEGAGTGADRGQGHSRSGRVTGDRRPPPD